MATGSQAIPPTSGSVRVVTNAGVDSGAEQQIVTLADSTGALIAPALDGTDITTPTAMPTGGVGIRGWLSAIWTKLNGTITVSNGQTQPLTDTQLRASAVSVSNGQTQPLTDTQLRASAVPISLATNTPDVTDRAARAIGTVTQQAITKGTQGTTGVTTQDLKDAGRQTVVLSAAGVVSVTAVALMTLNQYVAGVVTAGVTTYTVPAGKTLRIQSIQFGSRFTTPSTTVTFASTTFALRFVTTGTTVVGSPILHQDSKLSASNTPTPNSDMAIPDGLELPAGYNFGVTHLASAATLSEDVAIVGFLY